VTVWVKLSSKPTLHSPERVEEPAKVILRRFLNLGAERVEELTKEANTGSRLLIRLRVPPVDELLVNVALTATGVIVYPN
jgi:hypothetical protein